MAFKELREDIEELFGELAVPDRENVYELSYYPTYTAGNLNLMVRRWKNSKTHVGTLVYAAVCRSHAKKGGLRQGANRRKKYPFTFEDYLKRRAGGISNRIICKEFHWGWDFFKGELKKRGLEGMIDRDWRAAGRKGGLASGKARRRNVGK